MNVLVIEQEKLKAQKIKDWLFGIDESIHVVGIADSVTEAAVWLNRNSIPDIILANTGFVAEMEKKGARAIRATITLSTDSEELKLRALRYKTMRYYLDEFNSFTDNGDDFFSLHHTSPVTASYKERFLVKQGQKLISVHVDRIAYFFSEERFIFFRTFDNQKFLSEYRIEQLEQVLSPIRFFRVNRSLIISIPAVKEIHAYFGNRLKLYLSPPGDKEVIVSRKRVSSFKEWLGK